jgi:protein-S-isoprenylcysteine O-methyltransferase Ste14
MMNNETVYQLVAIALLGASMSISIYYRSRAMRSGEKISSLEEGKLILNLRRIFGLALWLSTLAYLINPRWMAWASLPLPAWLRWSGAALMALCVPLVYWVFSSLGKNVTQTVAIRREHSLVTSGPYRWVRHPLYTVAFLNFIGLSLLAADWFIPLALVLGIAVLVKRTGIEEDRLIQRFGEDYRSYMQTTGRFVPRLKVPQGEPE